ncbi:MAG: hypothetical protein R3F34_14885 [Planctomycetota bacterium]
MGGVDGKVSRRSGNEAVGSDGRVDQRSAALLLATGDANDVLAALLAGDPLELGERLASGAVARALLVRPERLRAAALAHCARRAEHYRGRPSPERWIARRVDEVLLEIEREPSRVGGRAGDALDRAAARFDARPRAERRALWRLVFEGLDLDEVARADGTSLQEAARSARRALDALLGGAVDAATAVRPEDAA